MLDAAQKGEQTFEEDKEDENQFEIDDDLIKASLTIED